MGIGNSSCSKNDDDEPKVVIENKGYNIEIHNNIDKSIVNPERSDGNLYEVYIVSTDGMIVPVGDINANTSKKAVLKPKKEDTNTFFIILKLGSNKQTAGENAFYTPEQSLGNTMMYRLDKSKTSDVYISEKVKYSQFRMSDIKEFENMLESILLKMGY